MSILRRISWVGLSLIMAAILGWAAFQAVQQESLPRFLFPLLFPILLGSAVGGGCVAAARLLRIQSRSVLLVAVIGGGIEVAMETWCSYRAYVTTIDRQLESNPLAVQAKAASDEFRAASLSRFVQTRIRDSSGWWLIDAGLTVLASLGVAWACGTSSRLVKLATKES